MKKIFALALAFIMVMGSVPAVMAEDAPVTDNTADVQKEEYIKDLIGMADGVNDEASLLSEYADILKQVYPDYKSYSTMDDKVSRGDFLVALVNLVYGKNYPACTLFGDVPSDNTALLDSLGCAVKVGMISPSDTFRPDDAITYAEMYKMAVVALGYDMIANQNGGWPSGYMYVASRVKLDQNVEGSDGEVSAKDALTVLYNAITLEFMEQTSFGETQVYTVAAGKSILSERYNTELISGIVNADEVTSITDADGALSKGEITIGTQTYKNLSGKSLLGYQVKAYVRTNGKQKEVISISKYENSEIFTDDFEFVSANKICVHSEDGKSKDYSIYRGYSAILNNVAAPYINLSDYEGRDDVTLYLIDNNSDKTYDVVKIYDWDYMQIDKIDPVNMILFDKNAPSSYADGKVTGNSTLNLNPDDVFVKIYDFTGSSLKRIELDDLSAGDVISYVLSNCGKSLYIFKSSHKVSGVLDEFSSSDRVMYVNSTTYELSDYAYNNFSNFIVGEEITLYLDATGKILSFSQGDDKYVYGYMMAMEKESGLNSDYRIKMFTQNGNIEIIDVADELYIDNVRGKASALDTTENSLAHDDRMIKYSLGSKGEIVSVDFAQEANPLLPFTETKPERDSFTLFYDVANQELSMQGYAENIFMAESNTILFQVPTESNKNDESYYLIKSFGDYRNGQKTLKAFDMAAGKGPKVVLVISNELAPPVDKYSTSCVFLELTDGINAEGEPCKLMTTYDGSAYKKYYVDPSINVKPNSNALSDLVPGDIISVSLYKNEIKDVYIFYSMFATSQITLPSGVEWDVVSGYVYAYGSRMLQLWDNVNINSQVDISNIKAVNFTTQNVTFIDLYKNSEGKIYKAMARYKPVSEIKTYLSNGTGADFYVSTDSKKWIYRIIER